MSGPDEQFFHGHIISQVVAQYPAFRKYQMSQYRALAQVDGGECLTRAFARAGDGETIPAVFPEAAQDLRAQQVTGLREGAGCVTGQTWFFT